MNDLEMKLQVLEDRLNHLEKSDRLTIQKTIQMFDGRNIQTGRGTGTKFGTATTQKLGFFNQTPRVQVSAISTPTGGAIIDAEARSSINQIITGLKALGLTG